MLILSRRVGESVMIGDDVTVTVLGVKGGQVRLGFAAPQNVAVHRQEVFERIQAAQLACSFSEITIVPQFGVMPYEEALKSTRLFAQEVLPALHKMDAPLHPAVLPG